MVRTITLPRALAGVLAIAALSAQAATAQPSDLRSPDTKQAAIESQMRQDLRSPDAADGGLPAQPRQDLRAPDTRETRPPVSVIAPSRPQAIPASDDGTPWAAIGIGLAGAGLLGAGSVAITSRSRRRARVAA